MILTESKISQSIQLPPGVLFIVSLCPAEVKPKHKKATSLALSGLHIVGAQ